MFMVGRLFDLERPNQGSQVISPNVNLYLHLGNHTLLFIWLTITSPDSVNGLCKDTGPRKVMIMDIPRKVYHTETVVSEI